MLLLIALLAAAPVAHRSRAEHAEALGRMQEAAREYQAAWEEERAPELLYRLGIVRRKLKQYGLAREALRAYLREAPEGGLRDEVERQLAKLEVLIEAQSEDYSEAPERGPPRPRTSPPRPAAPPASSEQRSLPRSGEVNSVHQPEPSTLPAPAIPVAPIPSTPAVPTPDVPVAPAAPAETTGRANPGEQRSLPQSGEVNGVHLPGARTEAATVPAAAIVPGPVIPPRHSSLAPWLAGGAVITAAAGTVLWLDGARLSRDLDARFAAGDLSPNDRSSYSRVHNEALAGRLLVAGAAGLLAAAVVLWW